MAPRLDGASDLRVVYVIAGICVFVELLLQAGDFGLIPVHRLRALAYEFGGFWPGLLANWRENFPFQRWTMFLTYGALHAGIIHLVLNMVTLVALGREVAERVDGGRFALIYAASTLGGAIGFALLADTFRPMVGASGALFGLAGAILAWEYRDRLSLEERLWPVGRAVLLLAALNAALYFAMGGHLAWEAHLGGFIAGGAVALLIDRRPA